MARFSQQYIDFVSRPEFQALLDWQPKVGDWFLSLDSGCPRVVGNQNEVQWLPSTNLAEWTRWLPTLSDLLSMLEEAGWSWNAHHIPGDEGTPTRGYTLGAIRITDFWASDYDAYEDSRVEKDKELAAARLFERVVGKEERDESGKKMA